MKCERCSKRTKYAKNFRGVWACPHCFRVLEFMRREYNKPIADEDSPVPWRWVWSNYKRPPHVRERMEELEEQ